MSAVGGVDAGATSGLTDTGTGAVDFGAIVADNAQFQAELLSSHVEMNKDNGAAGMRNNFRV